MKIVIFILAAFLATGAGAATKDSVVVQTQQKRHIMQPHQYEIVTGRDYYEKAVDSNNRTVTRYKDRTEVEIFTLLSYDSQWQTIESNCYLLDPKSKDKYMLHSTKGDIPMDVLSIYRGLKGKIVKITLIFPPLKEGVTRVHFRNYAKPHFEMPSNAGSWMTDNLKVREPEVTPYNVVNSDGNVIKMNKNFKLNRKER